MKSQFEYKASRLLSQIFKCFAPDVPTLDFIFGDYQLASLTKVIERGLDFRKFLDFSYNPVVNPRAIARHIEILYGYAEDTDGFIAFRGLPEKGREQRSTNHEWLPVGDLEAATARLHDLSELSNRSGFMSACIIPGLVGNEGKAGAADVVAVGALVIDFDSGDPEQCLADARAVMGEPTMVMESGSFTESYCKRLHAYWRLKELARGSDVSRVYRLNELAARAFGGDSCFKTPSQPARLCGSINLKSYPAWTSIIEDNAQEEHELDDLADRLEAMAPAPTGDGNLSFLEMDFSRAAVANDRAEVFDRVTREGAIDGVTRYDDMTAAMGYAIAGYRRGDYSLEFAQDIVRAKNTRLSPPWAEGRLAREWQALLRKDFENHGPVVPKFADAIEDDEPFSFAELAGLPTPPREWLVDRFISPGTTTALFGEGGIGKSILALHMGLCVSHGKPFMGIPTKKARVFGLFCEDDKDELRRRMARFCDKERISVADTRDIRVWSRDGKDNFMTDEKGHETEFYSKFWTKLEQFQGDDDSPILVIIDTAAHVFGGNEIARREVTRFVATQLGRIAKRFGAVLLLAHPSKAGILTGSGDSGSTGWNGSVRSRAYLYATEDKKMVALGFKKANYGKKLEPLILDMKDGVFSFVRQGDTTSDDLVDTVMEAMRSHEAGRGNDGWKPLSPKDRSPRNPWTVLAGYPGLEGVDKDIIRRAYKIGLSQHLCKVVPIEGARSGGQDEEVIPA